MKKDLHPANYREVVFKDMSNDEIFITRSTVASRETIEIDGKEYPLVKLEITSASHPFFTGKQKLVLISSVAVTVNALQKSNRVLIVKEKSERGCVDIPAQPLFHISTICTFAVIISLLVSVCARWLPGMYN